MTAIKIFDENYIDLLNTSVTITITDSVATNTGQSVANYMRNRSINSAWITTDSTDAANTQIDIDMGDEKDVEDILIVEHNLKSYVISYWNGASYTDLFTATNDTETTSHITGFGTISTNKIRVIINGTKTTDDDKYISRLLITKEFGTFNGYPQIKDPTHTTNKTKTTLLSGVSSIVESTGSFKVKLSFDNFTNVEDLQLIEGIYRLRRGLNYWLCGGNEDQFRAALAGYRRSDIYLMRPEDDYSPEWYKSIYSGPIKLQMSLIEVVR